MTPATPISNERLAALDAALDAGHADPHFGSAMMFMDAYPALRERLRQAEELLRPFAKCIGSPHLERGCDDWDGAMEDCPLHLYLRCWGDSLTLGDCRAAAAYFASVEQPSAADAAGKDG